MQSGPWLIRKESRDFTDQIPVMVVAGGEGEPAREGQGVSAGLAGDDVMVGVDRRGWKNGDPKRGQQSSATAAVLRRGGSPAADRRWGNSSRGSRWFY
jgi:hypothetical protein